jgi:hypothetical protein
MLQFAPLVSSRLCFIRVCHIRSVSYLYRSSFLVPCGPYTPRDRCHRSTKTTETVPDKQRTLIEQGRVGPAAGSKYQVGGYNGRQLVVHTKCV